MAGRCRGSQSEGILHYLVPFIIGVDHEAQRVALLQVVVERSERNGTVEFLTIRLHIIYYPMIKGKLLALHSLGRGVDKADAVLPIECLHLEHEVQITTREPYALQVHGILMQLFVLAERCRHLRDDAAQGIEVSYGIVLCCAYQFVYAEEPIQRVALVGGLVVVGLKEILSEVYGITAPVIKQKMLNLSLVVSGHAGKVGAH